MECLACNYINYYACCLRIGRHMGERQMKVVERGLDSKRGQKRGILTSTRLEIMRVVEDGRKAKKASGKKNVRVRERAK